MCLSGCTFLNEILPVIGMIGIILALLDYAVFGKRIVKSKNVLVLLTAIFLIVIALGATITFPGALISVPCNYVQDIILCKYLGIGCARC